MATDPSLQARDFMARFFAMGAGSNVTSHEPHATLKAAWDAYQECRTRDWIKVEPYNRFGSVRITASEEGRSVAQARFREVTAEMFAPLEVREIAERGGTPG